MSIVCSGLSVDPLLEPPDRLVVLCRDLGRSLNTDETGPPALDPGLEPVLDPGRSKIS